MNVETILNQVVVSAFVMLIPGIIVYIQFKAKTDAKLHVHESRIKSLEIDNKDYRETMSVMAITFAEIKKDLEFIKHEIQDIKKKLNK